MDGFGPGILLGICFSLLIGSCIHKDALEYRIKKLHAGECKVEIVTAKQEYIYSCKDGKLYRFSDIPSFQ